MAITFLEQRRRQKQLLVVIGFLFLLAAVIIWQGFFAREAEEVPFTQTETSQELQKVKIDFDFLEQESLKKLKPFVKIAPFDGAVGRENPFLPY